MNMGEFELYKQHIAMHMNGSNVHTINNQLGLICCAISMIEVSDDPCEIDMYNKIIFDAKDRITHTIYHIK